MSPKKILCLLPENRKIDFLKQTINFMIYNNNLALGEIIYKQLCTIA